MRRGVGIAVLYICACSEVVVVGVIICDRYMCKRACYSLSALLRHGETMYGAGDIWHTAKRRARARIDRIAISG